MKHWRAVLPALALLMSACGTNGLSFQLDQRVSLRTPSDHADVTLPLTVTWTVKEFAVGNGAGSFGVLIDRTPPPAGKGLDWLFRNDDSCVDGCKDPAYRALQGVYETTQTGIVFKEIPVHPDRGDANRHEVTVVLLDADGRRVGEGAWSREFDVVMEGER